MPLVACPDCGKQVSTEAAACPGCGRPMKALPSHRVGAPGRACPYCGAHTVGKVRGLQGVLEVLMAMVLFAAFIIPGLAYYIYLGSVPYCSGCGRRVWK